MLDNYKEQAKEYSEANKDAQLMGGLAKTLDWLFSSPEVRFYGLATFGLLVGGFICPPTGQIDGSVLIGCGLLVSMKLISVGAYAVKQGRDVSIQHKETRIDFDGKGGDDGQV